MKMYGIGGPVGVLEPWPFIGAASDYRIVAGDPQMSGRLDSGGPGHMTRCGIWRCTAGSFECTEQGDEMMVVLSGACILRDLADGTALPLAVGDTAFLRDGRRVRWEVTADLTKAFMGYKPGGY